MLNTLGVKYFAACDFNASHDAHRGTKTEDESMLASKNFLTFAFENSLAVTLVHDLLSLIIIFFLTSFFINSIHQLVAVKDHCDIFHEKWKGE
jgi:hypothetical protein